MLYDKLLSEFTTISETAFWAHLLKAIKVHRDLLSGMCETKRTPPPNKAGSKR